MLHKDLENFRTPGGLFDVEPCEMDLNVGRRGRLRHPDVKTRGTKSLESFEVIAIQKNYHGDIVYRVVFESDAHRFGIPMLPNDDIEWLD